MNIGIFGKTTIEDKNTAEQAIEIGRLLASHNHTVVTGGTEGYPDIAARAAANVGGKTICYAIGLSESDHRRFHHIDLSRYKKIIFQKAYFKKKLHDIDHYLRSLDMCLSIDAAVVIGGRVGTMYEVTILSGMSKNIFVLENSGGITDQTIRQFKKEGHKKKSKILFFKNSKQLVRLLGKPNT